MSVHPDEGIKPLGVWEREIQQDNVDPTRGQARQPGGNVSPGSLDENRVTEVMTTTRSGARSIIAQPESNASAAMA